MTRTMRTCSCTGRKGSALKIKPANSSVPARIPADRQEPNPG